MCFCVRNVNVVISHITGWLAGDEPRGATIRSFQECQNKKKKVKRNGSRAKKKFCGWKSSAGVVVFIVGDSHTFSLYLEEIQFFFHEYEKWNHAVVSQNQYRICYRGSPSHKHVQYIFAAQTSSIFRNFAAYAYRISNRRHPFLRYISIHKNVQYSLVHDGQDGLIWKSRYWLDLNNFNLGS